MRWLQEGWRRVRSLAGRRALESGLDDEIRFHIEQQTEKCVRAGMSPEEARRHALLKFGGVEGVKESARDEFRATLLEDALRDVRYGARALRRAPGFTVVCSLTLALSIGAATAVFSVVNGVLIKPLPYPDSEALVSLWNVAPGSNDPGVVPISATQFFTYRDENRAFRAFGLWSSGTASVTGVAEPEEVETVRVTHGTLQALGVAPDVGRWFSENDDTPASPETVILSNAYWQRRYGRDPSVIGRTLTVDSRPRTVIGVMPADFRFLNQTPDVILPFRFDRSSLLLGSFNYFALGRLQPNVTVTQANTDVARMIPIWLHAWPSPPGFDKQAFARSPVLRPLKRDVVGDIGNVLWVLMATIGIVLLIACANVANLLLVRAERRHQELAVRAALGAGWRRIARALFIESVLLGLLGGLLGLGLTFVSLRLLVTLGPASLPRLTEITVDPAVLSFALIVSLLSSALFGLIPIAKQAGPHIVPLLQTGERTSSETRGQHRTRNTLVVVQVSLALVLLVGSGLMIRTFWALRAVQPGFTSPDHVQLVRITIPATLVDDPERVFRMQTDIRERMAAIPGVAAASFASAAPMEPFVSVNVLFSEDRIDGEGMRRRFKFVSPGFFATVGTPLLAGRDFAWTDLHQPRAVAVISANMAREMWGDPAAAVGKRIRENPESAWREIVGVVGDVFDDGVHTAAPTVAYWPAVMENFEGARIRVRRSMTFVIRSSRAGSELLLRDAQLAVWAVNGSLPVARVQTLGAVYEQSLARTSFTLVMLAIAAAIALLLGLVGIYGVIAYAVTQRTREIGIRVALGARPGELKRRFVRHGIVLAVIGVICGLAASVGLTRLMSSLLFGISPLDPATYAAVSFVLIVAAAIASYIPVHRAIALDPVKALRAQ
jgi:putative ABC transport system permease protein